MKKLLLILLTTCSIIGYGQILVDPAKGISTKYYNDAAQGAVNVAGTNTYTATYLNTGVATTGITTYSNLALTFQFANANTTTATLNINGIGAVTIKKQSSRALVNLSANDIGPNERKDIYYDGTYFVIKGGTGSGGGALTPGSGTTDNGTAVDLGGTQTSNAVISGNAGTYGTTFDEQEHFTVNVQGSNNAAITVADGGDANITSNSGNINLTTFSGNGTQIVASGTGYAFSVTGAGILANVNSDATGDFLYRNSSGYLARRGIGSTGNVLTVSGGLPTWATASVAVGGITGLGTGAATALGINVGSAGSFVTNGGALGTPSSGVATNLTGIASGLTAGTVTTNANLSGDISSSGNTTTYSGTVPINKGGSGQTTANTALNAFLPSQASANGKVLQSDGTNTSWQTPSAGFVNPMTSVGDIIQGSTAGAAVRLASVATGNALISGGITTANSWGKITSSHIDATVQSAITFGTGVQTALGVNVGSAGAPVLFNGVGGTPSSLTGTNITGVPVSTGISGLGSNMATFLGTPSSSNLIAALTDETGTGAAVFASGGTLVNPIVGTQSVGDNSTKAASTAYVAANASPLYPATNRQTASYTFALTDVGKTVEMNVASANTLTIPPNNSVAFPTNTQLVASQYGAGVTTLTAGAGVTFRNASGALAFSAQYTFIYAYKIGTDEWYIVNSTTPFINPMTTLGDIIYTDATPTATRLAGNTSATGKVLKQTGTGSISAAPVWAILGGNDILGTTTNDNATTGYIQENFRSIISTYTNYTTTATYQNIASITLTAGDYEIDAGFTFSSNGATITAASDAIFVISTTTASASGAVEAESISYIPQAALLGTSHESGHIVPYRVSLSGTTTYYLNTQASFTIGTPQFVGVIHARRVR